MWLSPPAAVEPIGSAPKIRYPTRGAQYINASGHVDFQGQPQIYLPTSQNYVHKQKYECFLHSRPEWFRFNESAHVMVKRKTLATDFSRRLGLVKSDFRSNPSSFRSNPSSYFSWNCGSNLPTYLHVSS